MKTFIQISLVGAMLVTCGHSQGLSGFLDKVLGGDKPAEVNPSKPTADPSEHILKAGGNVLDAPVTQADFEATTIEAIALEYQRNPAAASAKWENIRYGVGRAVFRGLGKPVKITGYVSGIGQDSAQEYNGFVGMGKLASPGSFLNLVDNNKTGINTITQRRYLAQVYFGYDKHKVLPRFDRDALVTVYGHVVRGGESGIVVIPSSVSFASTQAQQNTSPVAVGLLAKIRQPITLKQAKKVGLTERKALNDALLDAAKSGDWDTVIEALQEGASPSSRDSYSGTNVLSLLSREKAVTPAQRLKYSGEFLAYSVTADGGLFNWPLVMAVERGEYDLALLLIRGGADPEMETFLDRAKPTLTARSRGDTRMIELLAAAAQR